MIGDPLYDAVARRRDERRPARPAAAPDPEGVATYECHQPIPPDDLIEEERPFAALLAERWCNERAEARPYEPRPQHHGQPMHLVGYDWARDVT